MAGGTLDGRVALVTGGTGPLGRGIVAALAAAGASVAVVHDDPVLPAEAERLGALVLRADVADAAQLDAAVATTIRELGEIDVLVANASHRVTGSFLALEEAELRRCVEVDVHGALRCVQHVARRLIARGAPGRLLLVTSAAGQRAVPGSSAHAMAKAMAATIGQVAAVELGADGITCNVVAAGWTASPFLARADRDLALAATPSGRLVDPAEVGAVCAFLASDAAAAVNGAVVPVDGGYAVTKSPGGSPVRSEG